MIGRKGKRRRGGGGGVTTAARQGWGNGKFPHEIQNAPKTPKPLDSNSSRLKFRFNKVKPKSEAKKPPLPPSSGTIRINLRRPPGIVPCLRGDVGGSVVQFVFQGRERTRAGRERRGPPFIRTSHLPLSQRYLREVQPPPKCKYGYGFATHISLAAARA